MDKTNEALFTDANNYYEILTKLQITFMNKYGSCINSQINDGDGIVENVKLLFIITNQLYEFSKSFLAKEKDAACKEKLESIKSKDIKELDLKVLVVVFEEIMHNLKKNNMLIPMKKKEDVVKKALHNL